MITKNRWPFKKNKTGAINCCIAKGVNIYGDVCFASIKQALYKGQEVYWANNDDNQFSDRDWTFILNNQYKKTFYIFYIPKGNLTPNLRKAHFNKGLFDWNIKVAFYYDIDTYFTFKPFYVAEVKYDDNDIKLFDI